MSDWIDKAFLENILRNHEHDPDLSISSYNVDFATKKGDNYASDMYRTSIKYIQGGKCAERNIILKVIPSGEIQYKVMVKNNSYPREIAVYSDIISEVQNLLAKIGDKTEISPKCMLTTETPKMMLVFEDIKERGYQMVDRRVGLDLDHARLVIQKVAKLHACSAVVYQNNPSSMATVLTPAITTNPDQQDFLIFYKMCVRCLAKLAAEWNPNEWRSVAMKLQNLENNILAKGSKVFERLDDGFNVFNHDDLWTNNLMFKYGAEGRVEDVLLFDYQISFFGSPGVDLNYFFYGSVREDVRENYKNQLVEEYHLILSEILLKLKYEKIPTLLDIQNEVVRTGFHGLDAAFCLVPLAMMEKSENAEMDVFLQESEEGESFRMNMFQNPNYKPFIQKLLREFDEKGYLD